MPDVEAGVDGMPEDLEKGRVAGLEVHAREHLYNGAELEKRAGIK